MARQPHEWRANDLICLFNDFGIENKKLFSLITRLKKVFDHRNGTETMKDIPGRITMESNKGVVAFRVRGEYLECEMCGKHTSSALVNLHLKTKHGVRVNYF